MKRIMVGLFLAVGLFVSAAHAAPKHALAKVAGVVAAPVVHPKRTLKDILGSVVFAVENGVDVAHVVLAGADKAMGAISMQGKIPALDLVYVVVSQGDKDSGKLDLWLERQEKFLFGTSN